MPCHVPDEGHRKIEAVACMLARSVGDNWLSQMTDAQLAEAGLERDWVAQWWAAHSKRDHERKEREKRFIKARFILATSFYDANDQTVILNYFKRWHIGLPSRSAQENAYWLNHWRKLEAGSNLTKDDMEILTEYIRHLHQTQPELFTKT